VRIRKVFSLGFERHLHRPEARGLSRSAQTVLCFAVLALAGLKPAAAQLQPPKPPRPELHYQAARAALRGGNLDKANLEVKLALQDNPLDAESHFLLGCLLERKGEHDQAIVGFQRALALDPADPEALYNLGTMLLGRGEAVPASRLLENAVLIRPDHIPSYNNLAKAYYLAGLSELAVAAYEEALRRDPSNAIARKNHLRVTGDAGIQVPAAAPPPAAAPAPVIPAPKPQALLDKEANALRELVRDLPHVMVERRGGRLTLTGWTSGKKERAMLDRILGQPSEVPEKKAPGRDGEPSQILDLTSDDSGDPQRMLEIDAVLFIMRGLDSQHVGFNFLKEISMNFNYFATDHTRDGTGFSAPGTIGEVSALAQQGWMFSAATEYVVNIANASTERVAVLARPHLTALSGTPAKFASGGELVFQVSGLNSGDIKPYPFGTTLTVTPTLLRTPAEDGTPRVHVVVNAGRSSVLSLLDQQAAGEPVSFDKVSVASEAVLRLGQTLILSGLSQRESHFGRSGIPGLMYIPILKYLVSTKSTIVADSAVIILLTPRDPAFWDERNQKATAEFVGKRRAFLRARQGTPEDMRRFRERYPDWQQIAPNRFASHFLLLENSELYRAVSGQDLTSEDVDLELLGPKPKKK